MDVFFSKVLSAWLQSPYWMATMFAARQTSEHSGQHLGAIAERTRDIFRQRQMDQGGRLRRDSYKRDTVPYT